MKVLVIHNHYRQPGGEDVVFHSEAALLESHGHQVVRFTEDNHSVDQYAKVALAAKTVWNTRAARRVRTLVRTMRPDVIHVHNTFPLISPSIYGAAQAEGVPVVQTLHNFRLVCPGALLLRDGQICEDCLATATRWPGVRHGCYQGSRVASGVIAATLAVHSLAGTWAHKIDRYIALSEFAKSRFLKGGFAPHKVAVKPNFLHPDPGIGAARDHHALFVGRLSPEKGLGTLLDAFRLVPRPMTLKIVGDGPLRNAAHATDDRVEWLGHRSRADVLEIMKSAAVLVVPSESYEASPLTIIEAFATGLPVIATRLGTMAEMVTDGVTGLLFEPRNAQHLAQRIEWALTHAGEMKRLASRARTEFERKYSAERNYQQLVGIYEDAIRFRHGRVQTQVPMSNASATTPA